MIKANVLIVEDEFIIGIDLRNILSGLGYRVLGFACSAEQAVELSRKLEPDIVLMDIALQDRFDGIYACKRIREFDSKVRIIFTSAYPPDTYSDLIERENILYNGYIVKPYDAKAVECGICGGG